MGCSFSGLGCRTQYSHHGLIVGYKPEISPSKTLLVYLPLNYCTTWISSQVEENFQEVTSHSPNSNANKKMPKLIFTSENEQEIHEKLKEVLIRKKLILVKKTHLIRRGWGWGLLVNVSVCSLAFGHQWMHFITLMSNGYRRARVIRGCSQNIHTSLMSQGYYHYQHPTQIEQKPVIQGADYELVNFVVEELSVNLSNPMWSILKATSVK